MSGIRFSQAIPALLFLAVVFWPDPTTGSLEAQVKGSEQVASFENTIRPLLREYCLTCHSTAKKNGELDLERFTSLNWVKKHAEVWEHVLDQLATGEMPPKTAKPMTPEQQKQLTKWIRETLNEVALANAGDPGPVVLRRLSNHEYTYTIRDLTGVPSLDPAREFPVDGAAGEGFTNAGAALVMSPALLQKYLEGAKSVSRHMVQLPDGVRFSPSESPQDWTNEALARIRAFYARHTTVGDGSLTVKQGIPLDVGTGSCRLPIAPYLDALQGRSQADGLSPKYLELLRAGLSAKEPSIVLSPLREKFTARQLTAADVDAWQKVLWKFSNIGHIGRAKGPKAWQEPVSPLVSQQELRFKLDGDREQTLYLVSGSAGDGTNGDVVLWENPRVVAKGQPDRPIELKTSDPKPMLRSEGADAISLPMPAGFTKGAEFVVTARLAQPAEGSVQVQVLSRKPSTPITSLVPGLPILVGDANPARQRFERAFDEFRKLLPIALCYTRIVPVDEVVTLTLYHREDDHLKRLMLTNAEARELDRLWAELLFVSEEPLKKLAAFEQIYQYATQDRPDLVKEFEPLRGPIQKAAEEYQKQKQAADAAQRQAVLELAAKAWRRPLTQVEIASLEQSPPRLMLTRVLTSPTFLYRGERVPQRTGPVSDWELATRLSYFLWSSIPDDELRQLAAEGRLRNPNVLAAQARRMLQDDKIRRLATEFGCQWLHVRDVATLNEKSERHFPTFASVREDLQEEVTRFFIELFQNDRDALQLLEANHTFVNRNLADHYGLKITGTDWQRVDGLREKGRGGILGFGATLAKQSGASRTSAILRGTWVSEVVLGDKLPKPPKGVPVLPDEAPTWLTERQLIERHSRDANCAGCHKRIDPYGFALEGFDAIGRSRSADTMTTLADGTKIDGLGDLRDYLLKHRKQDFLKQVARKLLGYALGRSVQLSDQPLIDSMVQARDHHMSDMVEQIVRSRQFREIRGQAVGE